MRRNMMVVLGTAALILGPLVATRSVQGRAADGQRQHAPQGMRGDQPYGQMMSLNDMVEQMHGLMGTMLTGYQNMVHNLEKLQGNSTERPAG